MLLVGPRRAWAVARIVASLLVLLTAAAWPGGTQAQNTFEVRYLITFARLPVGDAGITADLNDSDYTIAMHARVGGVARVLANGEISSTARGKLMNGRFEARRFTSKMKSEGESQDVAMTLEDGNVVDLVVAPPLANGGVQVPEADRKGVVDPLTAMVVPAEVPGDALAQGACSRTLPIFDGRYRYDLKLAFKRMDKVTAEKGYSGPALVCSLSYRPVSGLLASNALAKYLSDGRDMEVVLAPAAGMRMLAPFGISISGTLASLVIWANRFEVAAHASSASPSTDPKPP